MSSSAQTEPQLPAWAVTRADRRHHVERVAQLVTEWADAQKLAASEKRRWLQAAYLHDALRDAPAAELRNLVPAEFKDWPDLLLHGPAAAVRLRREGFDDEGILNAITFHTVGHPNLDAAGRALYLADFLEPGRNFDPIGRATWRARMPHDVNNVLREVVAARIQHMINSHRPMRSETLAFWNQIAAR
jgi:predicted HD superfamily hydrolase involved in NAD metabolism